jgi:hypothetical protein
MDAFLPRMACMDAPSPIFGTLRTWFGKSNPEDRDRARAIKLGDRDGDSSSFIDLQHLPRKILPTLLKSLYRVATMEGMFYNVNFGYLYYQLRPQPAY